MSIYEFTRRKSSLDLGPGADGALPRTPVKHTRGIEFDSRTVHHLRPAPDNVNDPLQDCRASTSARSSPIRLGILRPGQNTKNCRTEAKHALPNDFIRR